MTKYDHAAALAHVALMPFCRNAVFWNSIVRLFIYICIFVGMAFCFLVDAAFTILYSVPSLSFGGMELCKVLFKPNTVSPTLFSPVENVNSFTEIFDTFLDVCFYRSKVV